MGQKKNPNGRWIRGNKRYDDATEQTILSKYREQFGWFRGARVKR